jgi:hypothetical protein
MRERARQTNGAAAVARQVCAEVERVREVPEASAGVSDSQEQMRRGLKREQARGRAAPERGEDGSWRHAGERQTLGRGCKQR